MSGVAALRREVVGGEGMYGDDVVGLAAGHSLTILPWVASYAILVASVV